MNVAESTMSLYENGKREPDFDTLLKISEYLEASIDYLLGNDKIKKPANEGELLEDEQSLLELYRRISGKSKDSLIQMLALVDRIPDDKQSELLERLQFAIQTHL